MGLGTIKVGAVQPLFPFFPFLPFPPDATRGEVSAKLLYMGKSPSAMWVFQTLTRCWQLQLIPQAPE